VAPLSERFVSLLQLSSYTLALAVRLKPAEADIFYSRDSVPLIFLVALRPRLRSRLVYEAHEFPATRLGRMLRRWLVRQVAGVIVITQHLAKLYADEFGVPAERLRVAPDGVRLERFEGLGDRAACRAALELPADAFVVGYVGQLHLMGMGKGVDTLTEAVAMLSQDRDAHPLRLCVVGGPDEMVGQLRAQAVAQGLPDDVLITPGQVRPHDVPRWMRAFDVCTLPSPWTPFFAYYTSPLKLFEYMVSGTPIVASDLPAFTEIITHEQSALLFPPSDSQALAAALRRLRDDPALGGQLAARARQDANQYTWRARAETLLAFAEEGVA
jgi:glycosyltransferase involved in cell wall biosynthesis